MSVKTTRIIGYGIYMSYQEFKGKFSTEDEFEEFCDEHSKLKIGTPCFVGDYMGGEWAFWGRILVATDGDDGELPNVDLSGLTSLSIEVDLQNLPSDFKYCSSKFMYLTRYSW